VAVTVGVPRETAAGERRVALVPEVVRRMTGDGGGFEVVVEAGAGEGAHHADAAYAEAGATIGDPWAAELLAKVAPPSAEEIGRLRSGQVLVGHLEPLTAPETARALAAAGVTSFAVEAIPRTTRAQSMDALSSQATVAGYLAVLIAAREMGRFFPMLTTAAGTIPPAKVLVLGAGVAGLQAIATARRLGAVVTGFDVRSVVKEQVSSLGARFLEIEVGEGEGEGGYAKELSAEQQQAIKRGVSEAATRMDAVITTAQIPGRPAPKLIDAAGVEGMATGSVIVDLAGASGGNCELTEPGQTAVKHGVTITAPLNLPSEMAEHASQLYAQNVRSLVELMVGEGGALALDFDDEIIAGSCLTREGEIVHEGAKRAAGAGS